MDKREGSLEKIVLYKPMIPFILFQETLERKFLPA